MNKQIYELAEQAGMERAGYANGTNIMTWREGFDNPGSLEKFAELIVKECMNRVRSRQQFAGEDQQNVTQAFDLLVYDLESHFGVE